MSVPTVYSEAYDAPLPSGHRFPMGKFARLAALIAHQPPVRREFIEPAKVERENLVRVHDPRYVDAILTQTLDPLATRRIGLPVTAEVALRARAATGGTIATARAALEAGIACNTAGGSHHAGPEGGAGFCVFNDVAVAIRALQAEGRIARALVIDADVHQGDGTALAFAGDLSVFTFSIHCAANYPTRKPPSALDVALPRGAGDEVYLAALDAGIGQAFAAFDPDIVFYNAGVDPHVDDALGLLNLSDAGLAERERLVLSKVRSREKPLAIVMGGGYGPDLEAIARRHLIVHLEAARWIVA